jgi:hypothetical protein
MWFIFSIITAVVAAAAPQSTHLLYDVYVNEDSHILRLPFDTPEGPLQGQLVTGNSSYPKVRYAMGYLATDNTIGLVFYTHPGPVWSIYGRFNRTKGRIAYNHNVFQRINK